jgi:ribosomal protein L11 methyltransferase
MPTVRLIVSTSKKLLPLVSELLFDAGAGGVEQRSSKAATLVAYADDEAKLTEIWRKVATALGGALPASQRPRARIEVDASEKWRSYWTEHLRPVRLTRKLWLAPQAAAAPELRRSERLLTYAPALAFGDGDHPTTRLAARAIEAHYGAKPGGALLDIGAGTGVLSFVAVLSGARRALGTDVSREAVRAANGNARLNELDKRTRFVHSDELVRGRFDLVAVNIELRPLLEVLANLPAAARRAPRLLVTGFLASQLSEVSDAVKAAGFSPAARKSEADWRMLLASR